jgi:hypothetical protein
VLTKVAGVRKKPPHGEVENMRITVDTDGAKHPMIVTLPDEQGTIEISQPAVAQPAPVQLAMKQHQLLAVNSVPDGADQVLGLQLDWDVEPEYVARLFTAALAGQDVDAAGVPAGVFATANAVYTRLTSVLRIFGYRLGPAPAATQPAKAKPAKARHRFDRKLADVPFHVQFGGATATVFWRKAKEMEIAAGAQLRQDAAHNQDGSASYGMKYGDKLRADNAAAIKDFRTTQPVTLRSVNEVGLFLYYGDTNGWLQLINADGQTLGELTEVK